MRATLLGLIDYLVLLVLPGADMLLMDWVAVGRICKGGDYSPLQNIIALIANQRAISPTSILIKLKLNLMWVSCKSIKTLAPLLCFFVFLASETLQFPLLYHHRSHHQRFPCRGSKWIKWWVCWENVETAALDIRAHHSYDLSFNFYSLVWFWLYHICDVWCSCKAQTWCIYQSLLPTSSTTSADIQPGVDQGGSSGGVEQNTL